jgi:hypothetical protein
MGCHTWFYNLVPTYKYRSFFREAEATLLGYITDPDADLEAREVNREDLQKVRKGDLSTARYFVEGSYVVNRGKLYKEIDGIHDVFRIKNYPKKVLHSFKEFVDWTFQGHGKDLLEEPLTQNQVDRMRAFWIVFPNGIVTFG